MRFVYFLYLFVVFILIPLTAGWHRRQNYKTSLTMTKMAERMVREVRLVISAGELLQ